jgi:two-component system KDP operon response regulator KdpE
LEERHVSQLLIIEDDAAAAGALATLLRRRGHDVTCAATAGEGLHHLRGGQTDLVLLDIDLPYSSGLELLGALAEDPCLSDVRVTIYSGHDDAESQQTAARLGACDYIVKGLNWDQTYSRIESCLRGGGGEPPDVRPA